jgi:hypothetical protein
MVAMASLATASASPGYESRSGRPDEEMTMAPAEDDGSEQNIGILAHDRTDLG